MKQSQSLKFDSVLLSTAAKPIPTKELLSRLNALHHELSSLEQDTVDLISLENIKNTLINKKLIKHTNKGVQIYVACCLADILRLFAPDAPYNDSVLSIIFTLFIQQFTNLSDTESPYYENYITLLQIVAEVKLIALMTDLSNKDKLIPQIFELFYSLSANKYFDNESLQQFFIDILNEVISEINQLDMKILKLIFNKFLANSKNLKNQSNIKVPGFEISLSLCELNSDKLSRFVTFFFSEMILEATKVVEDNLSSSDDNDDNNNKVSENDDSLNKLSNIDLIQMKKIHNLAIELWRYVPEILTSVLGLLDNELEADDFRIRMIATDTVSKILAIQSSKINFPTAYVGTYMNWLKKSMDISIDIRITWLNGLAPILEIRNDIITDVVSGILKTMIDSNEKVRLNTIVELSKLKPSTFLDKILNTSLDDTLLKLLREKNGSIRYEIIQFLAALYNYYYTDKEDFNENEFINKIPNNILNLIYINDNIINAEIDLAIFEKIIPFNSDSKIRVNRLLLTLSLLTEKSKTAFMAIIKRQNQLSQVIFQLLELIEDQDLDESDKEEQITHAIKWLSNSFPPSYNSELYINHLIELNNKRFFRLLKLCISESSDYDTIVNSMKELLNRVKDPKFLSTGLSANGMYNTIKLLLLRCSNIFYNISNISDLIEVNNNESSEFKETTKIALNNISKICPKILESQIKILSDSIITKTNEIDFDESRKFNDFWKDLKIIYNFTNQDKSFELSKKFYDSLYDLAIRGSVLEAKYSIKIIANASDVMKGRLFTGIVSKIWPVNINSPHFNTHLSTISNLFISDMISVDHIKEDLGKFLANEILLKNHSIQDEIDVEIEVNDNDKEGAIDASEKKETWISDDELYYNNENKECLSKILAMKLLTNWLISAKDDVSDDIEQISKPILSMLSSFINRGGEIVASGNTPPKFCSRLRLHAGIQLLKISQISSYDPFIDQRRINRLVLLIQDVEYEVRFRFLKKLKKRLSQNKISKRFLSLIFFAAHEPDISLRSNISTWIKASFAKENNSTSSRDHQTFEKSYIRLLYMLSNHPELRELYISYKTLSEEINDDETTTINDANETSDSEHLKKFKELSDFGLTYIIFSLSLILTSENVSLLYYLNQRIKQFEAIKNNDVTDEYADCLYFIAELSQTTINYIGKIRNWNISLWNGKLTLPQDLFTKLDNETANKIIKTSYIPDDLSNTVSDIIRVKWRREHGFKNTRKSKKNDKTGTLHELNVEEERTESINKSQKRKRSTKIDRDLEDYSAPKKNRGKENIPVTSSRRTRRGRRVDYTED